MADIFISYAREDEVRIQPLVRVLENRAWSIFWDRHIPAGQTWRSYIGKALGDARCVIVAWSRDSIVSDWVSEEADEGKKRGILIPVLLDAVEPPIGFRSIQAADLTDWQSDRLSPHFEKLLHEIRGVLQATPTPTPTLAPPTVVPGKTGPSKATKFPLLGILLLVALVAGGTIAIWRWSAGHSSTPTPIQPTDAKSSPLATPESSPRIQRGDKAKRTASVQPPSSEYPKPGTSTPVPVEPSAAMSATSFSTDRDHPTRLRSGEVRGTGRQRERVRYYLSFLGGPGEVKATFDFTSRGIAEQAIATLFNQDFEKIGGLSMILNPGESVRKVKRIQVSQQQTMVVELDLQNGAFLLRLEGAVRFP
jgi:hypothetical protein